MKTIDEIIIRYVSALWGFSNLIKEIASGDWSKADLIYENHPPAKELYDKMLSALEDFKNETSSGNIYTCSDELLSLFKKMEKHNASTEKDWHNSNKCSFAVFLENIRHEWDDKIENGDVKDIGIVKQFDAFFELPNYDPDSWLKRKFIIKGAHISSFNVKKVPKSVVKGFNEASACFIYGNYLATAAMARSVLEDMLKTNFKTFSTCNSLSDILYIWCKSKVDELKNKKNYLDKAYNIKRTGNEALHKDNDKILQLMNEMTAQNVLNDLKDLVEFIYK